MCVFYIRPPQSHIIYILLPSVHRSTTSSSSSSSSSLSLLSQAFREEPLAYYFAHHPSAAKDLAVAQFHIYCKCVPKAQFFYTLDNRKGAIIAFHLPKDKVCMYVCVDVCASVVMMMMMMITSSASSSISPNSFPTYIQTHRALS